MEAGIHVAIANGTTPNVIPLALNQKTGTYFPAMHTSARAAKE